MRRLTPLGHFVLAVILTALICFVVGVRIAKSETRGSEELARRGRTRYQTRIMCGEHAHESGNHQAGIKPCRQFFGSTNSHLGSRQGDEGMGGIVGVISSSLYPRGGSHDPTSDGRSVSLLGGFGDARIQPRLEDLGR